MLFRKGLFVAALVPILACPPALALGACEAGELCILQSDQFGCRDASLIKRWVDLNIEESREVAENFIARQVEAGQCARFKTGDRLRIVRYIGMRRLEVLRAGETQHFIMLLR